MYTSKWCNDNINGNAVKWDYFTGELKELLEARNLADIREELSDTIYAFYSALQCNLGINLPMIGAGYTIRKELSRQDVWRSIFKEHGLPFDIRYLVNGSNYTKPVKVEKALALARADQKRGV